MAGLVRHPRLGGSRQDVDARVKPAHDEEVATSALPLQNEIAVTIHRRVPAGRHYGRRVELFDDGGTGELSADREALAVVDRRFHRIARGEEYTARAFDGV